MKKFSHKSNRTPELSRVLRLLMLINLVCIFRCKLMQVRDLCVYLHCRAVIVFNTLFLFKFGVSNSLKTHVPQAFAGFCVYRTLTFYVNNCKPQIVNNSKLFISCSIHR